jgi:hypothetical protein
MKIHHKHRLRLFAGNKKLKTAVCSVAVAAGVVGGASFIGNPSTPDAQAGPASAVQTSGNWSDYADGGWLSPDLSRYDGYDGNAPGSSADYPYLIESAGELAYLGVSGASGQFAGKYIKLSRGCNCDEPLTEIDFSAHYWDPVYLYGAEFGSMFTESNVAHIDGNNVALTGIKINALKSAEHVVVAYCNHPDDSDLCAATGDEGSYLDGQGSFANSLSYNATAAGLFAEVYKARVANFRLVEPEFDNKLAQGYYTIPDGSNTVYKMYSEEAAGSLIGVVRRSRVLDNRVENPNVQFNTFGRKHTTQMAGGMIGMASGYAYMFNNHVDGGNVTIKASLSGITKVLEQDVFITLQEYIDRFGTSGDMMTDYYAFDDYIRGYLSGHQWVELDFGDSSENTYNSGGLIGRNYHSVTMNSSANSRMLLDTSELSHDIAISPSDIYTMFQNTPYYQQACQSWSLTSTDCYGELGDSWSILNSNYIFNPSQRSSSQNYEPPIAIGGLIGASYDESAVQACVMNSYANTTISLIGQTISNSNTGTEAVYYPLLGNGVRLDNFTPSFGIGGLVGSLWDSAVNNYATMELDIATGSDSLAAQNGWTNFPGYVGVNYSADPSAAEDYTRFYLNDAQDTIVPDNIGEVFGHVEDGFHNGQQIPLGTSTLEDANLKFNPPLTDARCDNTDMRFSPYNTTYYYNATADNYCYTKELDDPSIDWYWDYLGYYPVRENYYNNDANDPWAGIGDGYWNPQFRNFYSKHEECDAVTYDPDTVCYLVQDSLAETVNLAAAYSDNNDLLVKMNAGLGNVERVVRGHIVASGMIDPALADWMASFISGWVLDDNGQIVLLSSQKRLQSAAPENKCTGVNPPQIIVPAVPNTGRLL